MPVYKRDQLDSLLSEIQEEKIHQVYLLSGERFLCQQAAGKLCEQLTQKGGNCHLVDGEREDFATTLNRLASFSLFPGRQVYRVNDSRLFHSVNVARSLWKKAVESYQANSHSKAVYYLKAMFESAGLDPSDPDNDIASFSAAQWKKLFGFTKPQEDVKWTASLLSDIEEESSAPISLDDAGALLVKTLESGIPGQNHLVLLAEDVDKRKRLYKFLAENQVVIDLGVEKGSSSKVQASQKSILRDLLKQTLEGFDKKISPKASELLFERVGFHPVAVVMEAEKLALYTGSKKQIDVDDLDAVVGRTRQEAVFELTDALGKKDLERSLIVAGRLADNGIHPLAIIATVKNFTRNLLLFRALQERSGLRYSPSMQPGAFQKQILPALKEDSIWTKELSGHPYALYMQFKTASGFTLSTLEKWMELILLADFRLKGSPIIAETVLQHLLISLLAGSDEDRLLQKNNRALH